MSSFTIKPATGATFSGEMANITQKWNALSSLPDWLTGKDSTDTVIKKVVGNYPSGEYQASTSMDSEEFNGEVAHFFIQEEDYTGSGKYLKAANVSDSTIAAIQKGLIKVDLVISDISHSYSELSKITPHLGETFSAMYYGKSPMILQVQGKLLDTMESNGKQVMSELYTKLFRASMVARFKVPLVLSYLGVSAVGCFMDMTFSESVISEDVVDVSFQFLVFRITYTNALNQGRATSVRIEYDKTNSISSRSIKYPDYDGVGLKKPTASDPLGEVTLQQGTTLPTNDVVGTDATKAYQTMSIATSQRDKSPLIFGMPE